MIDIRDSKRYVLRDSSRGFVFSRFIARLENSKRPIVGVVKNSDDTEDCITWGENGEYTNGYSAFDLIEEDYRSWKVDARVLVRDNLNGAWTCGYFAGVIDGHPSVFPAGRSSWTARVTDKPITYNEAKLASDE